MRLIVLHGRIVIGKSTNRVLSKLAVISIGFYDETRSNLELNCSSLIFGISSCCIIKNVFH